MGNSAISPISLETQRREMNYLQQFNVGIFNNVYDFVTRELKSVENVKKFILRLFQENIIYNKKNVEQLVQSILEETRETIAIDEIMDETSQRTILHFAVQDGMNELCKYLIEKRDAFINCRDTEHITPLHIACIHNYNELIIYLVKNDADINAQDMYGIAPLSFLIQNHNKEMFRFFIRQPLLDMDVKSKDGKTYIDDIHQDVSTIKHLFKNTDDFLICQKETEEFKQFALLELCSRS